MRVLKIALSTLILVIIIALAVFLIPQHMQIRAIDPPIPDEAQLRSLLDVENRPVRVSHINVLSQPFKDRAIGYSAFVVEWANGDLFMIDAAMDRSTSETAEGLSKVLLGGGDGIFGDSVVDALGENIARVKGVGFTHLHDDHTQGLSDFCAVRGPGAFVYQTFLQQTKQNIGTVVGASTIADSCLERGELHGEKMLESSLFPGLSLVAIGGHTPGSTLFAVAIEDHLLIFSGDTTNSKAELTENRGKGFFYNTFIVPEHTERTEKLRLWLRDMDQREDVTVIVAHDILDAKANGIEPFAL